MLFRIIALDIDGTLTNSRKMISSRTKSKLMMFQKNGGRIVLASGRPTQGIMPYASELRLGQFGGFIMAYNGGTVIECSTGEAVSDSRIPKSFIPSICELIKDYPVGINTYKDGKLYAGQQINKYTIRQARINFMPLEFDDDFAENVTFDVPKCLLQGEPQVISELEEKLVSAFGSELGIFRSEPFLLEIVPKGIDKAKSLDGLLRRLNIPADQSIAFGDGFNDVSMIRYAGLGIAMSNAPDAVKNAADFVTASNDEDGVAVLLSRMGRSVFPSLAML